MRLTRAALTATLLRLPLEGLPVAGGPTMLPHLIYGRVEDASGEVAAGATVSLHTLTRGLLEPVVTVAPGPDGFYVLSEPLARVGDDPLLALELQMNRFSGDTVVFLSATAPSLETRWRGTQIVPARGRCRLDFRLLPAAGVPSRITGARPERWGSHEDQPAGLTWHRFENSMRDWSCSVGDPAQTRAQFEVAWAEAGEPVQGCVVNGLTGEPVAGAEVWLGDLFMGLGHRRLTSNASGEFDGHAPALVYPIVTCPAGLAARQVRPLMRGEWAGQLPTAAWIPIEGRVVEHDSARPLRGGVIWVSPVGRDRWASGEIDAAGSFRVARVPVRPWTGTAFELRFHLESPSHGGVSPETLAVAGPVAARALALTALSLPTGAAARVRVEDAEGAPLTGIPLRVLAGRVMSPEVTRRSWTVPLVDGVGLVAWNPLSESVAVEAAHPRGHTAPVRLGSASDEVVLTLQARTNVTVRVLDEAGRPMADALVEAGGDEDRTDTRGEAHLWQIPRERVTVSLRSWAHLEEEGELRTRQVEVDLASPEFTGVLAFTLGPPPPREIEHVVIRGRVVDVDGNPVPGAQVYRGELHGAAGLPPGDAVTDASGEFTLVSVLPRFQSGRHFGSWGWISARAPGHGLTNEHGFYADTDGIVLTLPPPIRFEWQAHPAALGSSVVRMLSISPEPRPAWDTPRGTTSAIGEGGRWSVEWPYAFRDVTFPVRAVLSLGTASREMAALVEVEIPRDTSEAIWLGTITARETSAGVSDPIVVRPTIDLGGIVCAGHVPLAGAVIRWTGLDSGTRETGDNGRFRIGDLLPWPGTLEVTHPAWPGWTLPLDLREDGPWEDLLVDLTRAVE